MRDYNHSFTLFHGDPQYPLWKEKGRNFLKHLAVALVIFLMFAVVVMEAFNQLVGSKPVYFTSPTGVCLRVLTPQGERACQPGDRGYKAEKKEKKKVEKRSITA